MKQELQLDEESTTGEQSIGRQPAALSRDDIFELLSNQRRRYVLHYLKQRNGETTVLGDLSEHVAAWENDTTPGRITAAERKRVYNSLQQYHLPKMHTNGVIEYDSRRGRIELAPEATALDVYLDIVNEDDLSWGWYYAGASSLCLALVAGAWAGLYPQLVSGYAAAVGIATVFLLSSIAHLYFERRMRVGADGPPPGQKAW